MGGDSGAGATGGDCVARPVGLLITAVLVGCTSAYGALRFPPVLETFREILKTMSADPGPAILVLDRPYIWYVFAAIGIPIAAWIVARTHVTRAELRRMKLATVTFG